MIQLLLTVGLLLACGDDQQETEVNKIKKHETAEDVAERINADIQRVKDKVYQEGIYRMQKILFIEKKRREERYRGSFPVYCAFYDPGEETCHPCVDAEYPKQSMEICSEATLDLPRGGYCYWRLEECLTAVEG